MAAPDWDSLGGQAQESGLPEAPPPLVVLRTSPQGSSQRLPLSQALLTLSSFISVSVAVPPFINSERKHFIATHTKGKEGFSLEVLLHCMGGGVFN